MLRCPECRTRRTTFASMLAHIEKTGHKYCTCGGYWWPKHRPGSPCCEKNERGSLNCALREAKTHEDRLTVLADWAFNSKGVVVDQCPF